MSSYMHTIKKNNFIFCPASLLFRSTTDFDFNRKKEYLLGLHGNYAFNNILNFERLLGTAFSLVALIMAAQFSDNMKYPNASFIFCVRES